MPCPYSLSYLVTIVVTAQDGHCPGAMAHVGNYGDLVTLTIYDIYRIGGGAGQVDDLADGARSRASAVAAGSMFVFQGTHRAVLINFPSQEVLKEKLYSIS